MNYSAARGILRFVCIQMNSQQLNSGGRGRDGLVRQAAFWPGDVLSIMTCRRAPLCHCYLFSEQGLLFRTYFANLVVGIIEPENS